MDKKVSLELSRELSLFHITMMGLGMMIGAGVFIGIGNSIFVAGPGGVILTFTLNGVLAIMTAMSYAELSSAIPHAGGAYNFARIGFGRSTSFLAGWMEWFASSVAGSIYAITFSIYLLRYLVILGILPPEGYGYFVEKLVAGLVALFFLYINYRGASETGKVGAFFTLGQTLFLIIIGAIGLFVVIKDPSRLANFKPFLPYGWHRILITMGFTYVAFEGYEVIAQAGDETIDPKRNLPKAMLYSVVIVTFTYVFVALAAIVSVKAGTDGILVPWKWIAGFREKGFGEAIARLMPMGNIFLTLAVIFASTSALNATIYSATRASYALGRDRMLPAIFSNISKKQKTPWVSLLFTGIIILFVAILLPTMDVASSASIMFLFLFFLVNLSVIKIRRNMSDELEYGFLMPLFPLFPVIAIIGQIVLSIWLIHMSYIAWIIAPLWIVSGLVIYYLYSRHHAITTEDEILIFEEEKDVQKKDYRLMVSIANPDNALNLVRTSYRICKAKKASVELLHMIPVPDQVPISDADKYMMEGKEGIVESMLYLTPMFPVSTTIRYCRNIARGIVSAVREKHIDMLIVGWHGRPKRSEFRLGSIIDSLIERTPCNVAILKNLGHRQFKRILVPLAGGPNGLFAMEMADIIAKNDGGEVTFFTVKSDKYPFDLKRFIEQNKDKLTLPENKIHIKAIMSFDIINSILEESRDHDLVVLGCTRQPLLFQFMRHSIPETVAQKCQKPVVMAKASGGIRSWIKRWI
ncbi:MAG: amino acid permease [Spirochaetes bacterium]|nr:amino acid permease [Spirochaetota bacterium]